MVGDSTFLRRVVLRNYKSIAACDVSLGPLRFLVGPNGSGKSNFLDALRFVTDSLTTSLDHAMRARGGIKEVRRRSAGHPNHFQIRIEFNLPDDCDGLYEFRIGAKPQGGFEVQSECCEVRRVFGAIDKFHVEDGQVLQQTVKTVPVAANDRLFLVAASGLAEFRPVFDALSRMGFYNLNPAQIRELQSPDAGDLLLRDGGNLASVLRRMSLSNPDAKSRIQEYLGKVVAGIKAVDVREVGPKETLQFRQEVAGSKAPWRFDAANMSDGTLRALGILVALFQSGEETRTRVPLIGIEEPELALHPAAAGVLRDCLRDASERTQVLVTSHSPDLLDDQSISDDCLLAVRSSNGETEIGPLDDAGRAAIRERLYTAGELLRLDQLEPRRNGKPTFSSPPELFEKDA